MSQFWQYDFSGLNGAGHVAFRLTDSGSTLVFRDRFQGRYVYNEPVLPHLEFSQNAAGQPPHPHMG